MKLLSAFAIAALLGRITSYSIHYTKLYEARGVKAVERVRHNLSLYDFVRIDHFRGFAGYWEILV